METGLFGYRRQINHGKNFQALQSHQRVLTIFISFSTGAAFGDNHAVAE
jgi:hypothetical protein